MLLGEDPLDSELHPLVVRGLQRRQGALGLAAEVAGKIEVLEALAQARVELPRRVRRQNEKIRRSVSI